jgi:hypothetical protein
MDYGAYGNCSLRDGDQPRDHLAVLVYGRVKEFPDPVR